MGYLDDGGNQNWGLLFFEPKLQAAYKNWLKQVLTEKNPLHRNHAGARPGAGDPSDSRTRIHSCSGRRKASRARRERNCSRTNSAQRSRPKNTVPWRTPRSAWQDAAPSPDQDGPDDFAQGQAALYLTWELTQHRGATGQQQRCADQMQFLSETMLNFNRMIGDYLKNDLGCKQLVNMPGNAGAQPTT